MWLISRLGWICSINQLRTDLKSITVCTTHLVGMNKIQWSWKRSLQCWNSGSDSLQHKSTIIRSAWLICHSWINWKLVYLVSEWIIQSCSSWILLNSEIGNVVVIWNWDLYISCFSCPPLYSKNHTKLYRLGIKISKRPHENFQNLEMLLAWKVCRTLRTTLFEASLEDSEEVFRHWAGVSHWSLDRPFFALPKFLQARCFQYTKNLLRYFSVVCEAKFFDTNFDTRMDCTLEKTLKMQVSNFLTYPLYLSKYL